MNDLYSPHTGEHIAADSPAPWMSRAGMPAPGYDRSTQSAFFRDGAWVIEDGENPIIARKAAKLAEINIACRDAIYAGFDCDALGSMHHYPAQDKDQTNLAASVLDSLLPGLPADWATPFWCVDQAGVWALRPHTAVQIQQVGRIAKATIIAAIARCAGLEGQIEAISDTDPDAEVKLAAIVW